MYGNSLVKKHTDTMLSFHVLFGVILDEFFIFVLINVLQFKEEEKSS